MTTGEKSLLHLPYFILKPKKVAKVFEAVSNLSILRIKVHLINVKSLIDSLYELYNIVFKLN